MKLDVGKVLESVISILESEDELERDDRAMLVDMLEAAKRNL